MHTPANSTAQSLRVIGGEFPDAKLIATGAHAGLPQLSLDRPLTLIGSGRAVHLRLRTRTVSRMHAMILNAGGRLFIRDLASRLHVHVNGEAVDQAVLNDGDTIRVGCIEFVLSIGTARAEQFHPSTSADPASLWPDSGRPIHLNGSPFIIGRAPRSDLLIARPEVGRAHALLFAVRGQRFLRDLGSRTGVRLNGAPVQSAAIGDADVIEVAGTELHLHCDASPTAEDAQPSTPAQTPDASDPADESEVATVEIDEHPELDAEVRIEWPTSSAVRGSLEIDAPVMTAAPAGSGWQNADLPETALNRIQHWGPLAIALTMQRAPGRPAINPEAAPPEQVQPRRRWWFVWVIAIACVTVAGAAYLTVSQ